VNRESTLTRRYCDVLCALRDSFVIAVAQCYACGSCAVLLGTYDAFGLWHRRSERLHGQEAHKHRWNGTRRLYSDVGSHRNISRMLLTTGTLLWICTSPSLCAILREQLPSGMPFQVNTRVLSKARLMHMDTGVVEHGLFLGMADTTICAGKDGIQVYTYPKH
jgi:hypothetical protein